jgi:hypothetical protein
VVAYQKGQFRILCFTEGRREGGRKEEKGGRKEEGDGRWRLLPVVVVCYCCFVLSFQHGRMCVCVSFVVIILYCRRSEVFGLQLVYTRTRSSMLCLVRNIIEFDGTRGAAGANRTQLCTYVHRVAARASLSSLGTGSCS